MIEQALENGYTLSEKGLTLDGKNVKVKSEQDLFEVIGFDWVEYPDRGW
jgi:DNA polymerase/3'-5' exonuclease PolX